MSNRATIESSIKAIESEIEKARQPIAAAYARAEPLEAELTALNEQIEPLAARARALAVEIEQAWGKDHFSNKQKLRELADARMNLLQVLKSME